ncbi:hypothetical protein BDQ17DRAFT_1547247 [Cyathus striatus]|nr:hypothetical protein BDQ17DRAFT_1547247 [Cyathus striatus]
MATPPASLLNPTFPPEIFDTIINFAFDIHDLNKIKDISLGNNTFFRSARSHPKFQFRDLRLPSLSRQIDFLSFITDYPKSELSRRVKNLTVHIGRSVYDESRQVGVINRLLVPEIFPNVEELSILGPECKGPPPIDEPVSLEGLGIFIFSKHLYKLNLSHLALPYQVFAHAIVTVEELSHNNVKCSSYETAHKQSYFSQLPSTLEKLVFHPTSEIDLIAEIDPIPEIDLEQCLIRVVWVLDPVKKFKMLKHFTLVDYSPNQHSMFVSCILPRLGGTFDHLTISLDKFCSQELIEIEHALGPFLSGEFEELKTVTIEDPYGKSHRIAFLMVYHFLVYGRLKADIRLKIRDETLDIDPNWVEPSGWQTYEKIHKMLTDAFHEESSAADTQNDFSEYSQDESSEVSFNDIDDM